MNQTENQTEFIMEYNTAPKSIDIETITKICNRCKRRDNSQFDECVCDKKHTIPYRFKDNIIHQLVKIKFKNEGYDECIIETIANNFKLFDLNNIEIIIDNENHNHFFIDELEFEILTESSLDKRVEEYIKDERIVYFNRHSILYNLKPNKRTITENEEVEIENEDGEIEIPEPEKKYELDDCPICMEKLEENTVFGHCGHCLCNDCFDTIINSKNSICPTCRAVWDYNYETITEDREVERDITIEDIDELCDEENFDVLYDIVDIEALGQYAVNVDGYSHTLGCYVEYLESCDKYVLSYDIDF
jgi:hypothetical protein